MSPFVTCPACGLVLKLPPGTREHWLTCMRCQAHFVNPAAVALPSGGLTCVGVVGLCLLMVASIGCILGHFSLFLVTEGRPRDERPNDATLLILHNLFWLLLIVAAVMLLRTSDPGTRRVPLLIGAIITVLAAVTLAASSGLIAVFFGGR